MTEHIRGYNRSMLSRREFLKLGPLSLVTFTPISRGLDFLLYNSNPQISSTRVEARPIVPEEWFRLPIHAPTYINTPFSLEHRAIDLAANEGTSVMASISGKIAYADWVNTGYGDVVVLETPRENSGFFRTIYAHLSEFKVEAGQCVNQGEVIALSGNTGNSSGPHLHFEIRQTNWPFQEDLFEKGFDYPQLHTLQDAIEWYKKRHEEIPPEWLEGVVPTPLEKKIINTMTQLTEEYGTHKQVWLNPSSLINQCDRFRLKSI